LLTIRLVMTLSHPHLDVKLPSADLRLLLLLVGLLLNREELHLWMGCCGPHRDCLDGLECWCSGDGHSWGYHVAPLRSGRSRAPPST
jgi:hypothetical protein